MRRGPSRAEMRATDGIESRTANERSPSVSPRRRLAPLLLRLFAGHFIEDGADFLRLARVERVRLQQVKDQQAGFPLVELVHQAADPLLADLLVA